METHPFNLREDIPNETKILIVGTAPPPRFSNPVCRECRELDFDFFYGSEDNYMWLFLEEVLEGRKVFTDEMTADECCMAARELLRQNRIWMRDVLQTYGRKPNRECSPADRDIIPLNFSNFSRVFAARSQIDKLAFTSQLAAQWTLSALGQQGLLENSEEYQAQFRQWIEFGKSSNARDATKSTPDSEVLVRKYETPFISSRIGQRDVSLFLLPTPTARGPRGMTLDVKRQTYKGLLKDRNLLRVG